MFMNEPPKEEMPIPFFRTGAAPRDKVSLNVYHTIQIIKDRQNYNGNAKNMLKKSKINYEFTL